jgi:hypothetical protein
MLYNALYDVNITTLNALLSPKVPVDFQETWPPLRAKQGAFPHASSTAGLPPGHAPLWDRPLIAAELASSPLSPERQLSLRKHGTRSIVLL